MILSNIVITWMDGKSETYTDTTTSVRDGVLHVYQYHPVTHTLKFEWHFPITNIRLWAPEKNGHHHGTLSGRSRENA
jgi:hypothetical protein